MESNLSTYHTYGQTSLFSKVNNLELIAFKMKIICSVLRIILLKFIISEFFHFDIVAYFVFLMQNSFHFIISLYFFEDSTYNKYFRSMRGMNNELIADEDTSRRRSPFSSMQYTVLVSLKYWQSWSLQSQMIVAFEFSLL